jgi:hypothetical protein
MKLLLYATRIALQLVVVYRCGYRKLSLFDSNRPATGNSLGQSGRVSSLPEFVGLRVSEGPSSLLVSVTRTFVFSVCSV